VTKRPSKRILIFALAGLIAGVGSFAAGASGIDPAHAVTEARCSAGAIIKHAPAQPEPSADASPTSPEAATGRAQSDPATTIIKTAPAVGDNLIPNGGVETIAGDKPSGWSTGKYADNDATFTQVAGHNSNRAVRVDITKYTSGNAAWSGPVMNVKPGGYYDYSDWYRSNVESSIVVMFKTEAGIETYVDMGQAPASMAWAKHNMRFFVPAGVRQIIVSHALGEMGSLETDDFWLTEATPTGFSEPIVSITMDDGWASAHDAALPIMKRYSVVSTQYLVSGFLGTKNYMKPGQVYDFTKAGHDVAAHTFDHLDLTRLSDKDIEMQLDLPKSGLSKCYGPVNDFAAPYGNFDIRTTTQTKERYETGRSTTVGYNTADMFNPYELKVQNITSKTTPAEIQAWLDSAKQSKTWLILVYHQVDNSDTEFARKPADFENDIKAIVASGIKVQTVHDAYAGIKPQLKQ
jgi:peptidoglycan/xylan/chitin deacetylase (PgdA/CDA1 family)